MDTLRIIIQILILLVAIVGFAVWVGLARKYVEYKYFVVSPLVWLGHVIVFYVCYISNGAVYGLPLFAYWSPALRLHGIISLVLMGLQLKEGIKHGC